MEGTTVKADNITLYTDKYGYMRPNPIQTPPSSPHACQSHLEYFVASHVNLFPINETSITLYACPLPAPSPVVHFISNGNSLFFRTSTRHS